MKKIMILGASILQLPAIRKAREMGLDIPKVLEAATSHKIDGIMTLASDMPMRTVAAVARELGLVGIDEATALKATNKACMRQALQAAGVPIPLFARVESEEEFYKAVEKMHNLASQCIVKPADNSGSRGVTLLKSFDGKLLKDTYAYSRTYSRSGEVIVEEYMEGPEVSVETLSINGVCHVIQITDKLTTGAPYFVEMGHNQPSLLDRQTQEAIAQVAKAAVCAIGITDGPAHVEIKVTGDGPKIVEIGARLGGDNITTHLVPLSTGVDMVKCCIQIALGEMPDYCATMGKASAIRYLKSGFGMITAIGGIEQARKMPGIQEVSIVHGVGERAKCIQSSVDRIGFVVAQADTAEEAIYICERAVNCIQISTGT